MPTSPVGAAAPSGLMNNPIHVLHSLRHKLDFTGLMPTVMKIPSGAVIPVGDKHWTFFLNVAVFDSVRSLSCSHALTWLVRSNKFPTVAESARRAGLRAGGPFMLRAAAAAPPLMGS